MESNNNPNNLAKLEALLFYYGEPISFNKISSILDIKEEEVSSLVQEFYGKMESDPLRGLFLLIKDDKAQLATKPDFHSIFQKLIEDDLKEELTPAAIETLSIISYLGPISRADIDYIRGVNSSFTIRNLILRGLIERKTGKTKSNIYEYEASFDFLSHVGVKKIEDLPQYEQYHNLLIKLHSQQFLTNTQ